LPPPGIVHQRTKCVEALGQVQRVIAFTELAALRANHGNGVAAPRIKRRWADVRRGARAARLALGSAGGTASANGASTVGKPDGDTPPPMHSLSMSGGTLSCSECRKTAVRSRWTALAYGKCPANISGDHWTWRRQPHELVEGDGVVACTRCGGSVPVLRRGAFEGRQCPAWRAMEPHPMDPIGDQSAAAPALEGVAAAETPPASSADWGAWIFGLLGHKVAGRIQPSQGSRGQSCVAVAAPVGLDQPIQRGQAILAGTAWRSHVSAQGPGFVACLACGGMARGLTQLQAAPCSGWRERLPPRVAALTLLGDRVARAGGPQVVFLAALAARRGERPRPPE
jgi:hypothetical protein